MRWLRSTFALKAAMAAAAGLLAFSPASPAQAQRAQSGSVELAGHTVRCSGVRIVSDRRLPSEGAAAPGVLILNPRMLNEQPPTVRLFVFHHECGHHNVGDSELRADCWAVEQGVRAGWLDARGVKQVCLSFEDAPETATHPSGRRRCLNLDRCFASAQAALARAQPAAHAARAAASGSPAGQVSDTPRLVNGPTLLATGTHAYSGTEPCAEAERGQAGTLAARGIGQRARAAGCR